MEFTERETLQDVLIAHKFIMHMYCQFGLECSNQNLRNLFAELHDVASKHEFKIFKLMNDKNYYPTTVAGVKDVKQTLKMHTQMQEQLQTKLQKK